MEELRERMTYGFGALVSEKRMNFHIELLNITDDDPDGKLLVSRANMLQGVEICPILNVLRKPGSASGAVLLETPIVVLHISQLPTSRISRKTHIFLNCSMTLNNNKYYFLGMYNIFFVF